MPINPYSGVDQSYLAQLAAANPAVYGQYAGGGQAGQTVPPYMQQLMGQLSIQPTNIGFMESGPSTAPAAAIQAAGQMPAQYQPAQEDLGQLGTLFTGALGGALDLARQQFAARGAESGSAPMAASQVPGVQQEALNRFAAQSALQSLFPAQVGALGRNIAAQQVAQGAKFGADVTARGQNLQALLTPYSRSASAGQVRPVGGATVQQPYGSQVGSPASMFGEGLPATGGKGGGGGAGGRGAGGGGGAAGGSGGPGDTSGGSPWWTGAPAGYTWQGGLGYGDASTTLADIQASKLGGSDIWGASSPDWSPGAPELTMSPEQAAAAKRAGYQGGSSYTQTLF